MRAMSSVGKLSISWDELDRKLHDQSLSED